MTAPPPPDLVRRYWTDAEFHLTVYVIRRRLAEAEAEGLTPDHTALLIASDLDEWRTP